MCYLLSKPCRKQLALKKSEKAVKHPGCSLRNYTSLLSLNNRHQWNNFQQQELHTVLEQPNRFINCLTAKSLLIIFMHFLPVYLSILILEYLNIDKMLKLIEIASIIYCIFYSLLVLFCNLRVKRLINVVAFTFFTFLTSFLYSTLVIYYSHLDFVRYSTLLILSAQIFLLIFCIQSKYTLLSSPILPYLYICSVLIGCLVIFFLILSFCVNNRLNMSYFQHFVINSHDYVTIDYKKLLLSILFAFVFVLYEIFDLQYTLMSQSQQDIQVDFFTLSFNLISVDYFKIFLMVLSFLLKSIK